MMNNGPWHIEVMVIVSCVRSTVSVIVLIGNCRPPKLKASGVGVGLGVPASASDLIISSNQ